MQIKLNYCGQQLTVEFKGGDSRHRAKVITANLFVQDALEADARFGKLYELKQSYEDTPKAKEKAIEKSARKRKVTNVKTVNEALRWLAENGYNPTGENDLDDLMAKAGVEFPNLKR